MKNLLLLSILAIITGCSVQANKDEQINKTRSEILEEYKQKYGVDPLRWSKETNEQFKQDMQKGRAE